GLMIRSFEGLRHQALGFSPERVMAFSLSIPSDRYSTPVSVQELSRRLRAEIGALPGVQSVALASGVPLGDGWSRIFTIEGHDLPLDKMPNVNHIVSSPEYFRTLGIPLLAGRAFDEHDWNREVLVVTRAFADTYWPGQSPIGKRVRFGPPAAHEDWFTVVG